MCRYLIPVLLASSALVADPVRADLADEALRTAKTAATFLTDQVSTEGGYLWRYSADLSLREGEGKVESATVWVQPPGTPAVGEAYVRLYEATGDQQFLDAARGAAEALRSGQMRSGGWQAMIEFEPDRRRKWAYRLDPIGRNAKDQSSLDDDKTQSALRFVMQLDRALQHQDPDIHELAKYALDGLLTKGQFANGGFPQVWTADRTEAAATAQSARYPATWPRTYPGHNEYWNQVTLNDHLAADVFSTLQLADEIYGGAAGDSRYRDAAVRLADFLVRAQLPAPQPAWAQQYNAQLEPIWARKFEPPAITGSESQSVIQTLLQAYRWTGDQRFLEPVEPALDYLQRSLLDDGQLARFYELETNRPLYFTRDYQLTYDDGDLPTHYAFKVASKIDALRAELERLKRSQALPAERPAPRAARWPNRVAADRVREIVAAIEPRGAWVSDEGMRYHRHPGPVIDMRTTVDNLNLLASYLKAENR